MGFKCHTKFEIGRALGNPMNRFRIRQRSKTMKKITAIVLAAGTGSRMNSSIKKQFMEIKGKPVIWYSLFAFESYGIDQIILVTGKEDIEYCKKEIVEKYGFTKVTDIVAGGDERYQSVYNGLQAVSGDIVLIHDGARPLISHEIIDRCIKGGMDYGACIAGMPVKDTIKIVDEDRIVTDTPDRKNTWITQTPQCFLYELVKTVYDKMQGSNCENITDDAMVIERFSDHKVKFVEGDYSNIKVTTPEDILIAELLLKNRNGK